MPNEDKQYSFELDVKEAAQDFGDLSGSYLMVGGGVLMYNGVL